MNSWQRKKANLAFWWQGDDRRYMSADEIRQRVARGKPFPKHIILSDSGNFYSGNKKDLGSETILDIGRNDFCAHNLIVGKIIAQAAPDKTFFLEHSKVGKILSVKRGVVYIERTNTSIMEIDCGNATLREIQGSKSLSLTCSGSAIVHKMGDLEALEIYAPNISVTENAQLQTCRINTKDLTSGYFSGNPELKETGDVTIIQADSALGKGDCIIISDTYAMIRKEHSQSQVLPIAALAAVYEQRVEEKQGILTRLEASRGEVTGLSIVEFEADITKAREKFDANMNQYWNMIKATGEEITGATGNLQKIQELLAVNKNDATVPNPAPDTETLGPANQELNL